MQRLADTHYPNFTLVSVILNTYASGGVAGCRRSPRQCQERYLLLTQRGSGSGGGAPTTAAAAAAERALRPKAKAVVGYLMQAGPLLHASWPSHQSAEGVTPSVLPVVQVSAGGLI